MIIEKPFLYNLDKLFKTFMIVSYYSTNNVIFIIRYLMINYNIRYKYFRNKSILIFQ